MVTKHEDFGQYLNFNCDPILTLDFADGLLDYEDADTTDVALKYEANNILHQAQIYPITGNGPPQRGNFSGDLNFDITPDTPAKGKYLCSKTLNRIYVDMRCNFSMHFKWNWQLAAQAMFVRATVVFSEESQAEKRVQRCVQHNQPDNREDSGLEAAVRYHVLRSTREPHTEGVYYCGDSERLDSWFSVVVAFPSQPDAGGQSCSHAYQFVCKNSCNSGINRRAIEIIFTLEDVTGKIYGRQSIGARVCSCPKRDLQKDEKTETAVPPSTKRVSSKQTVPPNKKIKLEQLPLRSTDGDDMTVYNIPAGLQVVGRKTYEAGLTLFMNYMISHAAQSTDPNSPQLYNGPIHEIRQLLDQMQTQELQRGPP